MRALSINDIAHVPVVGKDGLISNEFRILLQQLLDGVCNQLHATNGVALCQQTHDNIVKINPDKNQSRVIYNTTDHHPYIFANGVLKQFVLA